MADALQHLIERIRREAVTAGDEQASRLVAEAKDRAERVVKEAEAKAHALVEAAQREATALVERGRQTLEQAARDVLISVGHAIENVFSTLAEEHVSAALDVATVKDMLVKIAEAYVQRAGTEGRIEALVSPHDRDRLIEAFGAELRRALEGGVQVRADDSIVKGFRVSFAGERAYHDFTPAAIAGAMCQLLQPHLAAIVQRAALGEPSPA
jgi:V/A-type H+-transporting ATPase subunit E